MVWNGFSGAAKTHLRIPKMKSIKALLVICALTLSSLAMAEGGGDRTFARMEAARKDSMKSYQVAQKQGTQSPAVESKDKSVEHAKC